MQSPEQVYENLKKRIVTKSTELAIVCPDFVRSTDPDEHWELEEMIDDLKHCAKSFAKYHPTGCAGLAANQIGYTARVFIIKTKKGFRAFVNPTFTPAGPLVSDLEGCLSVPNKQASKKRHTKVYAKSNGGKRVLLIGFEARAFQHELDHLNGITI